MRLVLLTKCIPGSPGQGVSSPNHQQGEAGPSLLIGRLWPLQRKRERVTHSRTRGDEGACSTPILLPGGRKMCTHTHPLLQNPPCSPCFKACSSHPTAYLEHSLPLITALLRACAKSLQLSLTLCSLPGSSGHRDSQGKNTGVGCHFLLQGIFPPQGSNLGLLHWRQMLYLLSHRREIEGSPIFLKKLTNSPSNIWDFLWSSAVLWWKSAELNVDASLNYILRRLSWKLGKEYRHSLAFYIHLCFDSAYFHMSEFLE